MTGVRAVVCAVAVVVSSIAWGGWSASREGWMPEGDSAAIVVRSHDVLGSDPPLLGNPTTAGLRTGEQLHHPGPIEFVALSLPIRALGSGGALLGAVLVQAAAVAAIAWLARRRGGAVFATWLLGAVAMTTWGLGPEVVHDVYNPHLLLLPLMALLVAGWSALRGDPASLPVAVVAASFVAQSHAYYALLVAVLSVPLVAAVVRVARPTSKAWLLSAALGLVLWLPPLVAEARPGPSNLAGLLRSGLASPGDDLDRALGPGFALARLADTLVRFRWLDRSPDPLELIARPSAPVQVLAVVLVCAVGLLGWRAHRRGAATGAALAAVAVVAAASSVLIASRLPGGVPLLEQHNHRHWWITGALVWTATGWLVASEARWAATRVEVPWRVALGVAAVPVVVASIGVAGSASIREDRGSVSFGAVAALADGVEARVVGDGPWLVTADGPQAILSVQPGLVAELVVRGHEVRVSAPEGAAMGVHRVDDGSPVAGSLLVVSADDPPAVPEGYELVARFDAVADARRHGRTNVVLFERPQQLAVFLAPGPRPPATAAGG